MCDYICTLCQNGAGVVHLESVLNHHNNPKRVSKRFNSEGWRLHTHIPSERPKTSTSGSVNRPLRFTNNRIYSATGNETPGTRPAVDCSEELTCQASGDIYPNIVGLLAQMLPFRYSQLSACHLHHSESFMLNNCVDRWSVQRK